MINMAVPHLGQSGPSTRLGECNVYSVPGIGAPPPLQAGVQASLAINPSRIIALQTWESCSILLTQSVGARAPREKAKRGRRPLQTPAWQRGAVKARWPV